MAAKAKEESNGNKATIREVVNMLDPLKEDVTTIKTLLTSHLKNYEKDCDTNKSEHKNFLTMSGTKTIATILGVIISIVTIFNIYLSFFAR